MTADARRARLVGRGLEAHLRVVRDRFDLDVRLVVPPGTVVALLGPNGAGKTTVLRALAGLQALSGGSVRLQGEVLEDPSRGRFVPPEGRNLGFVFQDRLLFAHLTVLENVAFGPRARGVDRRTARRLAHDWLERVGLGDLGHVRPGELSGGQAQRVALVRALATDPALLLLDEPMAALDASTRDDVRAQLRRHLAGFGGSAVLVTHDPVDAAVLSDRVVVIEGGRVVQEAEPCDIAMTRCADDLARLRAASGRDAALRSQASPPARGRPRRTVLPRRAS